ncbi:MAG TPA: hypothetical protein VMV77_05215 [Bacteroidales bacterium]|nr:hypothetical protein [Bacteroidales bacterium]
MPFKNAIGFFVKPVSGISYDPDLLTYIDGLITPLSTGNLALLNTMYIDWKVGLGEIANVSDADDVMYNLAGETTEISLRNMVRRAHDAIAVNSPVHVPLEGFQGDGIGSYVDHNYIPNSDRIKFLTTNASGGVYVRTNFGAGTYTTVVSTRRFQIRKNAADGSLFAYSIYNNAYAFAGTVGSGYYVANKDGESLYRNGDLLNLHNSTDQADDGYKLVSLAMSGAVIPNNYSEAQISFVYLGRTRTAPEIMSNTNVIEAYMDANERGVI